jgi:hypothetical protein
LLLFFGAGLWQQKTQTKSVSTEMGLGEALLILVLQHGILLTLLQDLNLN